MKRWNGHLRGAKFDRDVYNKLVDTQDGIGGRFLAVFCFVVAFLILGVSILSVYSPLSAYIVNKEKVVVEPVEKVEYYLPYPGILPDNPLWTLKVIRDRVSLWLTIDETLKSEKELLFADKRMGAAVTLVEMDQKVLGLTTASKAGKYLELAAGRIIDEQKEGKDVKSNLIKLNSACHKHYELTNSLSEKVVGTERDVAMRMVADLGVLCRNIDQALVEAK